MVVISIAITAPYDREQFSFSFNISAVMPNSAYKSSYLNIINSVSNNVTISDGRVYICLSCIDLDMSIDFCYRKWTSVCLMYTSQVHLE